MSFGRFIRAVFPLICSLMVAVPALSGTLSPGLERQLAGFQAQDIITVLVVLADQVDVPALDRSLRANKAGRNLRHQTVVSALQQRAAASQQDLLANLGADKATGGILGFTPHWLVNAVVVTGTVSAVRNLALRPDVLQIEADLVPELIDPVATWAAPDKGAAGVGIAPGIAAIGARRVWDELGIDGTGVLVGVIDTGVDVTHPAFAARWQGHFTTPSESWLDAAQYGQSVPGDGQGHGTHVMGIMTGLADGDTIGVAPGARWIATNGIAASTADFDNSIIASLEFMTDPDGDPATSNDVPDVVQNSWGVNESFAGYLDCDSRWWDFIDNCEAAGVVLVWAAGNEGFIAGTVRSPADRAASPYNCFSVGSTSNRFPFTISDFSSRGPSGCGGAYAIKPEITAPGDSIYSALSGGGYVFMKGTSMAGPHVAGVVALMRQANPDVDVTTIKDILMATAVDLGNVGNDNDYGHGLVDAFAAVQSVMGNIGTVSGATTDADSGLPIAGVLVQRDGGQNLTFSDANGQFSITMYAGAASFTASAFGYFDNTVNVVIPDGGTINGDLVLTPQPTANISGTVSGPDLLPVAGATVIVSNAPVAVVTTNGAGEYALDLPLGAAEAYVLRVSAPGLGYQVQNVNLTQSVVVDFELPELTLEDFESGGFASYPWMPGGDFPWQVDINQVYEGTFSARAADIAGSQSSELWIDYFVAADGDLTFWYKVSSEFSYDLLYFYVDDEVRGAWSGEIDWSRFSVAVPKGHHRFRWAYVKDEAASAGSDAAWLDLIEFPVTGEELFPDIAVSAAVVNQTLSPGTMATTTLNIANIGGENLNFILTAESLNKVATVSVAAPREDLPAESLRRRSLAKGEKDQAIVAKVLPLNNGGPDVFGYTWFDSDDPQGPVFDWVEISTIGTEAGTGDDMSLGAFELGFPMIFYGAQWPTVRISTNGFLSFSSTSSPYANVPLPDMAVPNNTLAPFWDDLDPSSGGQIYYWADPAGDRFVVQFQDVRRYDSLATETFEVILSSNGSIVFQYLAVSETGFCTVGLENAAGDDGLTVLYNAGTYLRDELAIRFQPPGFLPWVQISPLAGVVLPGEEAVVTLEFSAVDLPLGTYVASLWIASNDPDSPDLPIPMVLNVEYISDTPQSVLPHALKLGGAVPNPFNPQTEIRYALPRTGAVSLKIYDLQGRHVRTVVAGTVSAGAHAARWDGRDSHGRSVASGTYFARLVFAGEIQVKAMSLIR